MKTILLMATNSTGSPAGYVLGALIALLILGYLVYALIKPEKF